MPAAGRNGVPRSNARSEELKPSRPACCLLLAAEQNKIIMRVIYVARLLRKEQGVEQHKGGHVRARACRATCMAPRCGCKCRACAVAAVPVCCTARRARPCPCCCSLLQQGRGQAPGRGRQRPAAVLPVVHGPRPGGAAQRSCTCRQCGERARPAASPPPFPTCATCVWLQAKTSTMMAILRDVLNSGQPNHGLAEARVRPRGRPRQRGRSLCTSALQVLQMACGCQRRATAALLLPLLLLARWWPALRTSRAGALRAGMPRS